MTLEQLTTIRAAGTFHHATYRFDGIHEGLWIYTKAEHGFRGFDVAGAFFKDDPNLKAAEEMVRGTGVSVGAYGGG
jgi:hypothetical protein